MFRPIPPTYDFGMTYFRNYWNNRIAGGRSGAKAIRVLNKHVEHAPIWNTYNQVEEEGEFGIPTYVDTGDVLVCNGAIDIVSWLQAEINDDEIECKVSFICSLVKETGVMPKEDLDILINHKQNYVRSTERGRSIVSQYHKLGGVLQRKMETDLYRHAIYKYLYDTWLKDVVHCVKSKKFEEAEKLYFEAIKYLAKRYGMEDKVNDFTE